MIFYFGSAFVKCLVMIKGCVWKNRAHPFLMEYLIFPLLPTQERLGGGKGGSGAFGLNVLKGEGGKDFRETIKF